MNLIAIDIIIPSFSKIIYLPGIEIFCAHRNFTENMSSGEISVINLREITSGEGVEEGNKRENENGLAPKHVCKVLCSSSLGIISYCIIFIIPWTTIPRTNSIIYQSHWMEVILPVTSVSVAVVGTIHLQLVI